MDDSFAIKRRPNYLKIIAATLTVLTLGFGGGAVIASQMDDGSSSDGQVAQTTKSNRAELASQTGLQADTNLSEDGVNADTSTGNQTSAQNGTSTVTASPTATTHTSAKNPSSTSGSGSTPNQTQPAPTPTQQNPTAPAGNSNSNTADADAALRACLSTGNILSPLLALEICAGGGSGLSL